MRRSVPPALKLLALLLAVGALQVISGLSQAQALAGRPPQLDVLRSLLVAALAIGAGWGLWRGRRWGAALLALAGMVGFTKFLIPARPQEPVDLLLLLLPASLYALTISYAWRSTEPEPLGIER